MKFLHHTPEQIAALSRAELDELARETGSARAYNESDPTLRYRLQSHSASRYGRMSDAMNYDQMHHRSAALDYQANGAAYNPYQNQQLGALSQSQAAQQNYQNSLAQCGGQFNQGLGQYAGQWAGLGMTGSSMEAQAKGAPIKPPYIPPEIAVRRVDGLSAVTIGGQTVIALDDAQEAGMVADRLEGASLGMGDEVPVYRGDGSDPDFVKNINAAFKATAAGRRLKAGTANNDINQITSLGSGTYMIPAEIVEKLGGQSKIGEFFAALNPLRRKSGY